MHAVCTKHDCTHRNADSVSCMTKANTTTRHNFAWCYLFMSVRQLQWRFDGHSGAHSALIGNVYSQIPPHRTATTGEGMVEMCDHRNSFYMKIKTNA